MFVRDDGNWEPGTYLPSYLRRYPFATAVGDNEQFAVVIDRASDAVSDNPERPFFKDNVVSEQTQSMIEFCKRFELEHRRTKQFCNQLVELGLLSEQQVKAPNDESKIIANFVGVDIQKLNDISDEVLRDIYQSGFLGNIFAHLFSLENWNRLLSRRAMMVADTPTEL